MKLSWVFSGNKITDTANTNIISYLYVQLNKILNFTQTLVKIKCNFLFVFHPRSWAHSLWNFFSPFKINVFIEDTFFFFFFATSILSFCYIVFNFQHFFWILLLEFSSLSIHNYLFFQIVYFLHQNSQHINHCCFKFLV